MLKWRIYYADGRRFDSSQGEPNESPGFGATIIVSPDPDVGRTMLCKFDYYFYNPADGTWWGTDREGLLIRQAMRLPCEAPLIGITLPTDQFNELHRMALEDPDFPPRSSRKPRGDPRDERRVSP